MKIKYTYTVLIFTLASILLFTAFRNKVNSDECKRNDSVIKFSHQVHKDITECSGCHSKVKDATSLNERLLPTKEDCKGCHDVEDADNCNQCHFENVNEPLKQKKSALIFNHKSHLDKGEVCENCHKGLGNVAYSFESPALIPAMEKCYSCHGETKTASNYCEACHISTVNLQPVDHKTINFISSHKFAADKPNANCAMCHDNNSCDECHVATTGITETNKLKDFFVPFATSNFTDKNKQKLTRVHDINYQFTHGIEARTKEKECQSCHQAETFCVECHSSTGVMPSTHTMPGFVLIGKGSGGGQHSILAKRDIESCIACHDVVGQDPTCVRCHSENIR